MLFLYYLVGDVHVCMGCMGCIDCMGCTGGNFLLILMAPSWRRSATVSSNGQMMFHDLTGEGKEWILPDLRPSRWTKRRRKDNWRVKQTFSKCTSIFDGSPFFIYETVRLTGLKSTTLIGSRLGIPFVFFFLQLEKLLKQNSVWTLNWS
jgi:hypothetical protein